MKAITEKMQELARKKEDERQQQARDSDTLSTIIMPPVGSGPDQVSRPTRPTELRPYRAGDVDRAARSALRRVETALAAGSTDDRATERPGLDRPASDGDDSDSSVKDVVGSRPRHLKRWPSDGGLAGRPDEDETSSEEDDDQPSGNNNRQPADKRPVPPDSQQSTSTATPDESRTDTSLTSPTLIARATVI